MSGVERKIIASFNRGCVKYDMLCDGDKILIGLSGGKDSLMLLKLLAERSRIFRPQISVAAVHVAMDNIPYRSDIVYLQNYCSALGVEFHVLHTSFDETTDTRHTKCVLCSRYRRKAMMKFAVDNGFNKLALGHHQDDILTTLLMNMCFEGAFATMLPVMKLEHYSLTVIRPLCLIKEKDIKDFADEQQWRKQRNICPYEDLTLRHKMNGVLNDMLELNTEVRFNMWNSLTNIQKNRLPSKCK